MRVALLKKIYLVGLAVFILFNLWVYKSGQVEFVMSVIKGLLAVFAVVIVLWAVRLGKGWGLLTLAGMALSAVGAKLALIQDVPAGYLLVAVGIVAVVIGYPKAKESEKEFRASIERQNAESIPLKTKKVDKSPDQYDSTSNYKSNYKPEIHSTDDPEGIL